MSEADGTAATRVVAGRYRLEGVLGRGGMGVVWRAVDTLIERRVAIKELRTPTGAVEGERVPFVERALREARNAGRLNHPAVVAVHDVVAPASDDDAVYIVMEYVEAPTLADILDRQGPLPAGRVAAMGLGILDALDAAHAMGIVHRDIKPGNVLISEGDRVKLTDFGIALAAEDTRLTRSGVIGTHAYLAPECFDAGQAGPASDLWSLGATLFHSVSGRPPFDRDTTTATLRAILFEDLPAPPCEPRLAEVITGLLTRPIDQRLASHAARRLLQPVAAEPARPAPAAGPPPVPGVTPAPWEAQATSLHRPPAAPPPPTTPPPFAATQAGVPPGPHPTTPRPLAAPLPPGPGGPSGPGLPPPRGPVPGPGSGGPPRPPGKRTPWLVGGALASAAALVVVFAMVGGGDGGGGSGSGPEGALVKLLDASKNQDLAAAQAALCREDLANDVMDELGDIHVVSYEIGTVEERDDGVTVVNATIRTDDEDEETPGKVPVIKQDGTWKVCLTSGLAEIPEIPTDSSDTTDSTDSSDESATCLADQQTALEVANRYVSVATYSVEDAQACVYEDRVPSYIAEDFADDYFFYDHSSGDGTFVYTNSDDATLTVTVTMESDGNYWVTDATVS